MKVWLRRFWFIPPVVIGVLAVVAAPMMKSPPKKAPIAERAAKARVIKVMPIDVLPRVIGYGTTRPGRTWEAVAEVDGQIAWLSDDLKDGRLVKAGTDLLRIDDSEYRLALTEAVARINSSTVKDRATRASLAIAERDLKLLREDLNRKRQLVARGAATQTSLEAAERQSLNGETAVQNLRNTLLLDGAERDVLVAQKARAELDLARTGFAAPFDVRITDVKVQQSQYANRGQLLFSADGTDTVEVAAQFAIGKLRPLIGNAPLAGGQGATNLEAIVRLRTATHTVEWEAKVDRVSGTIDMQTQSAGVIVVVPDPYGQAQPGSRPPLIRNTFVEVELRGAPRPKSLVVPTAAVHDGRLMVVGDDNRLAIRPAKIAFTQMGFAVIAKGLKPGERVVVSDLPAAVDGMLLDPVEDRRTKRRLITEATGKEPAGGGQGGGGQGGQGGGG